jgi:hypothetical protein
MSCSNASVFRLFVKLVIPYVVILHLYIIGSRYCMMMVMKRCIYIYIYIYIYLYIYIYIYIYAILYDDSDEKVCTYIYINKNICSRYAILYDDGDEEVCDRGKIRVPGWNEKQPGVLAIGILLCKCMFIYIYIYIFMYIYINTYIYIYIYIYTYTYIYIHIYICKHIFLHL